MTITKEQKAKYYPEPCVAINESRFTSPCVAINESRSIAKPLFGEPKPPPIEVLFVLQAAGIASMFSKDPLIRGLGPGFLASAFTVPAKYYMD